MKKFYLAFLAMLIAGMSFSQNSIKNDSEEDIYQMSNKSALIDAGESASITTTYVGGNGGVDGVMFDVSTFGRPLTIESIDLHLFSTGTSFTCDIYTRDGTYAGNETTSSGWTLVATGTGVSAGFGNPTSVDLSDFVLPANTLTGFYVNTDIANTLENVEGIVYTNGFTTYANEDIQLDLGAGVWGDFGVPGGIWSPRSWNGAIHYSSFDCLEDIVVGNDAGECGAIVNYTQHATWALATVTQIDESALTSGDEFPVGITIQSYELDWGTIKDTCTFSVSVNDVEDPNVICKDIDVQLDATGNATIVAADVDNGSTDNCGIATLSIDKSTFTILDKGDNSVNLTVTDIHGNSSVCVAIVNISDGMAPNVLCNSIDIYLDAEGNYQLTDADIDLLFLGTTDNVDAYSDLRLFSRPLAFGCEDVGEVRVDLTAEDKEGNRGYCRIFVNVIDTNLLTIVAVDDIMVEADSGVCETQITYPEIISTDGCATIMQTEGMGADGMFPVGTTVETWKATNLSGDSVLFSFNVVVTSPNANPSLDSIVDVVVSENSPIVNVPLTGVSGGADCVVQDVSITAEGQNAALVSAIAINYSSPDPTASLDLTLVQDMIGTDTITVTVTDSEGATASKSFVLTVIQVNRMARIDALPNLEVEEDSPVITVELKGISYGDDREAQTISLTAQLMNTELVDTIVVNYTSPDSTGTLEISLLPDVFGEDTITVTVMDNMGGYVSESFVLNVTPVNDAPYLLNALVDGKVNASKSYVLNLEALMGVVFDDIDDDVLTFGITSEGEDGLPAWATFESGVLTAIPMLADTGSYSFVVTATDVAGAMAADTFMLVVEGYPTGINNFDSHSFDVTMYPNPTNGVVNLKFNSSEIMDSEVVVRSITGSEIFRKDYRASEEISIDLSEHVGGIYLITLKQGRNSVIKKLILDRK